jgi:dihydroorotate dehydrogenase (fumarate)
MDLTTTYMGFRIPNPLIPGASSLTGNVDTARRLEDAGAPLLIMHSLFEEQIRSEQFREVQDVEAAEESYSEALTYHPRRDEFRIGPDTYLEQVRKIKSAVGIPVMASLNGTEIGAWIEYAKMCHEAGADGIELNLYFMATDPGRSGEFVENRMVEVVKAVREAVTVPVSVKLSPFISSLPHLAMRLKKAGAEGIVIFNRFYQPDIDIENLQAVPSLHLSDSSEVLLRLRWAAILSGRVENLSIGVTGGVHTASDALKCIMAGAHGIQMASALMKNGAEYLKKVRSEMEKWMEDHEYKSVDQMRGSMSLLKSPDPQAFVRANYMKILQGGYKYV